MVFRIALPHRLCAAAVGLTLTLVTTDLTLVARSSAAQPKVLKIVVIEGEDAVNIIQQRTATGPIVEVRDENDLPVAGVLLRFRVSGGRAVFGGGLDSVTLTTNASGRAAVSGLQPLQNGAFQIEVTASYQGQTTQATITQHNFATVGDATRAGRKAQSGQSGASGASGAAGVAGAGGAGAGSSGTAVGAAGSGGISKLAVLGIIGAGAAGAAVAVNAATRNTAPALAGVTASASATLLGTSTPITFSAQASDADEDALSYSWDFGDGATSTEPSPSHVYTSAGTFTVRLTVSDGKKSAASETTVTVRMLTGTWRSGTFNTTGGPTEITFALVQSGTSVTGSANFSLPSGASFPDCPIQGFVGTTSPRVVLQQNPCPGVIEGRPTTFGLTTYSLDPSADANTLTGQIQTGQLATLTRQ